MPTVGLVGKNAGEMARVLSSVCEAAGHRVGDMTDASHAWDTPVNVLVAHDFSPTLPDSVAALTSDDYLILNADKKEIFPCLARNNAKLITYGFNAKSCVTASSVTDGGVQVCIQRGFAGLDGMTHEPQEFHTAIPPGASVTEVLGVAAACAVCGVF